MFNFFKKEKIKFNGAQRIYSRYRPNLNEYTSYDVIVFGFVEKDGKPCAVYVDGCDMNQFQIAPVEHFEYRGLFNYDRN